MDKGLRPPPAILDKLITPFPPCFLPSCTNYRGCKFLVQSSAGGNSSSMPDAQTAFDSFLGLLALWTYARAPPS